jgi:hypothetical protein
MRYKRHARRTRRNAQYPANGSNITAGHILAFQMVTTGEYSDQILLDSSTINGEPGVAIIALDWLAGNQAKVAPLFVAITENMEVILHNERRGSGGDEEGGPVRSTNDDFNVARDEMTGPAPR